MANVKVLLNNMFPAGICEMICDYNLQCSKCLDLHRKEAEFLKKNIVAKILTRPEQQILFFKECMNPPIFLSKTNKTNLRVFKRELDQVLDNEEIKHEFKKNKMCINAVKSFAKRYWKHTHHILEHYHWFADMKQRQELRCWWMVNWFMSGNDRTFLFRNKEFKLKHIIERLLSEYTKAVISEYKEDRDEDGTREHMTRVINI